MENTDHGGKQDQIADHSLPGTNQAGKGPASSEETDQKNTSGGTQQDHPELEEHSLPGTNQVGKGPASDKKRHR